MVLLELLGSNTILSPNHQTGDDPFANRGISYEGAETTNPITKLLGVLVTVHFFSEPILCSEKRDIKSRVAWMGRFEKIDYCNLKIVINWNKAAKRSREDQKFNSVREDLRRMMIDWEKGCWKY